MRSLLKPLLVGSKCILMSISLFAQTTFTNSASIDLPDGMPPVPGSPYGSEIAVSGMTGLISGLTITLNNVKHNLPSAMDILLVAPDGSNTIILSDVGSAADIDGITITLSDSASSYLPDGQMVSGVFKPTNLGYSADSWPVPAPVASGNKTLSVFNGMGPNGTWKLYAINDVDGGNGSIQGGWSITFTTQNSGVLPLHLRDFWGNYSLGSQAATLEWRTVGDTDPVPAVVQASQNGWQWKEIGRAYGSSSNGLEMAYHFIDKKFLGKKTFYRLVLTINKYFVVYSKVIAVEGPEQIPEFSVYPVPASSCLHIDANKVIPTGALVQVTDITGRALVVSFKINNISNVLDIHHLNPGNYIMKILYNGQQTTRKITVIR